MLKEKIDKFTKEHERELKIAKDGLELAFAVIGLWGTIVMIKDMKSFDKYWRKASKGAKVYPPACGEELLSLIEPYKGVMDISVLSVLLIV